MIINVSKPRREYFEFPSSTDIIRGAMRHSKEPEIQERISSIEDAVKRNDKPLGITANTIKKLSEEGLILSGVDEIDGVERIIEKEDYKLNHEKTINSIYNLQSGQVMMLPNEYSIPDGEAKKLMVYTPNKNVVRIDNRKILGTKFEDLPKKISAKFVKEHNWMPTDALKLAIGYMHERKGEFLDKLLCTYTWRNLKERKYTRISLYRNIEGAEIRAFQNLAYYKNMPTEAAIRKMPAEERGKAIEKLRRYTKHIQKYGYESFLNKLMLDKFDIIKILDKENISNDRSYIVLSRSQRPRKTHEIRMDQMPVLEPGNNEAYAMVWDVIFEHNCMDKRYHSRRLRKKKPSEELKRLLTCAHEIAAYETEQRYLYNKDKKLEISPFVIPTEETLSFIDNLRYRTFIIGENSRRRKLNKTEMENLLWKFVILNGYDYCFSEKPKGDAQRYLLKLVV